LNADGEMWAFQAKGSSTIKKRKKALKSKDTNLLNLLATKSMKILMMKQQRAIWQRRRWMP
jgi:hypothetical protein